MVIVEYAGTRYCAVFPADTLPGTDTVPTFDAEIPVVADAYTTASTPAGLLTVPPVATVPGDAIPYGRDACPFW